MVLLVAWLISLVVLALFGGKVLRIAEVRLRAPVLVFGSAVSTKLVFESEFYYEHAVLGPGIWLLGFVAVAVFVVLNWNIRPLRFAAVGSLCNGLVIAANHGKMPVGEIGFRMFQELPAWYRQPGLEGVKPDVFAVPGNTPLWFFGDIIPPVLPLSFPFSIGDVLLAGSVIWLTALAMLGRLPTQLASSHSAGPDVEEVAVTGAPPRDVRMSARGTAAAPPIDLVEPAGVSFPFLDFYAGWHLVATPPRQVVIALPAAVPEAPVAVDAVPVSSLPIAPAVSGSDVREVVVPAESAALPNPEGDETSKQQLDAQWRQLDADFERVRQSLVRMQDDFDRRGAADDRHWRGDMPWAA